MATINDIAKMAQVSTSTVSHVVNKTRYVSPELVERVNKAIQELDQPPNFILKKSKTFSPQKSGQYILFLISENQSAFQQQIEQITAELLLHTPYPLIAMNYSHDPRKLDVINTYLACNPDVAGIMVFPDEENIILTKLLSKLDIPIVILGREEKTFKADAFLCDTFDGAYKATKHLIMNGHEHIAFLGRSHVPDRSPKRLEGFLAALKDYGIEPNPNHIISDIKSEEEIYKALNNILSGHHAPTAILAANYATIIPLLRYVDAHNIECPKELSIISFSDFEWATLHTPSITAVQTAVDDFAKGAVDTLLNRINHHEPAGLSHPAHPYQNYVYPTKLIVRDSTCGIGRGPFGEKAETADSLILSESEMDLLRSRHYTAAISFHYAGKAWMQLQQKGIKDVFDNIGISIIATTDAHFNPDLQIKQLDSLRMMDPDVIIAMPTDNTKTANAFHRIVESPSKLILIAHIPDGLTPDNYVSCVSTNEHSHGRNMGHGLGEYMLKHGLKNLAIIRHAANFYTTRQRDNAAEQVIREEYPEITICDTIEFINEDEVFGKTSEALRHHPEIEAFYISWDGPAMEAMTAISEANRTDIAIVTGDLDYPVAMNMAKGGMVKMLSAQQPYEQGQAIGLAAAKALLGKSTPSFIGIEPICVTPENLLKSWKTIFHEDPPIQLRQAFKQNPNYIVAKDS